MLYAASSLSLACLEVLVHLAANQIPADYVYSTATLRYIPQIAGYQGDIRDELSTRRYGQWWATQRSELAIRVPSVVIPIEFNLLLNPTHMDFTQVAWDSAEPFRFDERLISSAQRSS
jgi:RES domain-containing protein